MICPAAWAVYLACLRGGHDEMARMTMRNMMAMSISLTFPFLGWGPSFRIGLRRWGDPSRC